MDVREDELSGFRQVTVSNSLISVSMLPQLGGKLVSLKHKPSDREWLHLNPYIPLHLPVYGASYVHDFDSGGWDECCPSVSRELHEEVGVEIPDHGEVWGLPWTCEVDTSDNSTVLKGWVRAQNFPFEFHRDITISPNSSTLHFSYRLRNVGQHDMHYLWCAHPILNIEEGMQISIQSVAEVRINGDHNHVAGTWPELSTGTRIDIVPGRDSGIARKLFVGPLTEGSVSVTSPRGESLRFTFDVTQLPFVGLWQNFGGWRGNEAYPEYYNMGVEPCSGMPDSLQNAVKWCTARVVEAQGEVSWSLEVELSKV